MSFTRRLSTRLMIANLLVLISGGVAFSVTFRLLASEIFDDRIHRGGPGGTGGGPPGGQGLLEAFSDSVDIALVVSLAVGVIIAGLVAWFAARAMSRPIDRIRDTTRAIAEGHYDRRVVPADVVELDALVRDVNELAEALEETEQARARLLSDVTHELRTPLASIDGFVEGAVDGVFSTEEMYEAVTDETARLLRLVEDLSVLSKTTEGSLPLDTIPVSLTSVVGAAVDQLRPRFVDRSVQVDIVVAAELEVLADPDRVHQIMSNLLANALGHVDDDGKVVIIIDEAGPFGTVAVRDDGEGIAPEDLPHVFDRFFRGTSATTRTGSGLGLTVARGIAEAHGGSLIGASDGPGTGATFILSLPRA